MKYLFLFGILFFAVSSEAQTRRIANRSHNASSVRGTANAKDSYGIPIYNPQSTHMVIIPVIVPIAPVTWIPDTVNGAVVWRLDTLRPASVPVAKPVSYRNLVIQDVSELGHVCSKSTTK